MIVQKTFQVRINITNPISFCADIDNNIKQQLTIVYKNKCYKNCYITEIHDILRRSDCVCGESSYLDVAFSASAIVYSRGDIITGCEITQRRREFILCSTARENIYVNNDPLIEALQEKLKIPIVVQEVAYQPYSDKINVTGSVFLLEKSFPKYKITDMSYTPNDSEIADLIKQQTDSLSQRDPKIVKVITETLKAWPTGTQPIGDEVQLNDLSGLKLNDIIGRDTRGDLLQPTAYVAPFDDYVELSLTEISQQLHIEHYKWLCFINEMCELYNEEELKRHRIYWTILASRKKVVA